MTSTPSRLLTIEEVADLLQLPVNTLYQWRSRGDGPPGMRLGRHVRYSPEGVERWLSDQAKADRSSREIR